MVTFYIRHEQSFITSSLEEINLLTHAEHIAWIDMLQPTAEEIERIEALFDITLPTKQEREEIELSSRYWEDQRSIMINSYFFVSFFFVDQTKAPYNESVTFVLQDNMLFTVRDAELQTFDTISKILTTHPKGELGGYDIFMEIFDLRIDKDADLLEYAAKESDEIRKKLLLESDINAPQTLRKISTLQEFTRKVRQSVFDKRRVLTALARSPKFSATLKEDLAIMTKDVNSLVEFITIDMNTLDNIQNLFLAQISIEQNKIIKLFTVASVALMPPTLVASIYGMNFHFMPELSWHFGYPFSLMLMAVSGAIPVVYFRKKGWL
ncbi:MAG: magnesium/cobalt transporter CorA [Sulfuricurvum sp.]|uniref:magnesium/cobalt transporter CorA n=1 Tax=Sulfuricurvum sp. TaxID=2025608 RepID=UPI00261C1C18|nr:magnesium/cobalt transporter CorA [Sulfuricurvum sp.]MDD2837868.1 magnesium/cobalt transporter CorA [Sulfuricurvum sp.]MDD3597476.1 magnesium/cobalt transporter CorA [Sulfuricurvum sp.]MDD4884168.1 magnesium/cobalt transporter CorA [Sulfuricurvum sp.]